MASNADFVPYIVDQCSGAGEITAKKMMGDIKATVPALPKPKSKFPVFRNE